MIEDILIFSASDSLIGQYSHKNRYRIIDSLIAKIKWFRSASLLPFVVMLPYNLHSLTRFLEHHQLKDIREKQGTLSIPVFGVLISVNVNRYRRCSSGDKRPVVQQLVHCSSLSLISFAI